MVRKFSSPRGRPVRRGTGDETGHVGRVRDETHGHVGAAAGNPELSDRIVVKGTVVVGEQVDIQGQRLSGILTTSPTTAPKNPALHGALGPNVRVNASRELARPRTDR